MPNNVDNNEGAKPIESSRIPKREAVDETATPEQPHVPHQPSFRKRFAAFRARRPLPVPTGEPADKAFFDERSGEFD